MFILQNRRPLKIGGPRRLPSLPNERNGPAMIYQHQQSNIKNRTKRYSIIGLSILDNLSITLILLNNPEKPNC